MEVTMNKKCPNIFKLTINDIYLTGFLYFTVIFTIMDIVFLFSEDASVILNGILSFFLLLFILLFFRRRNILKNLFINGTSVKAKITQTTSSLNDRIVNPNFIYYRIFFEYSMNISSFLDPHGCCCQIMIH